MSEVQVIQVDRDAAADEILRRLVWQHGGEQDWMVGVVKSTRRGDQDDHPDVQAFARHRLKAYRWLPIETAPRDGSWFLAVDADGNHFACAYYGEGFEGEALWQTRCGQPAVRSAQPTNWMPLPPTANTGDGR